jgi:hypothetical protein
MPKKKYVPPTPDSQVVEGVGPDVDLNSLPVFDTTNPITKAITKEAADEQKKMELIRAGVKETPPSEPLHEGTTKSLGVPMSDRNYNNAPSPFKADAPAVSQKKSMSHSGTVIEKR